MSSGCLWGQDHKTESLARRFRCASSTAGRPSSLTRTNISAPLYTDRDTDGDMDTETQAQTHTCWFGFSRRA